MFFFFFQDGHTPLDYLSDTLKNDDEWFRPIKTAIDVSFVQSGNSLLYGRFHRKVCMTCSDPKIKTIFVLHNTRLD